MTLQVKVTGSEQQHAAFSQNCAFTEALFANTLAMRLETAEREDWRRHIQGWFESVRSMAVANWISSGMKAEVMIDGQQVERDPLPFKVVTCGTVMAAFQLKCVAEGFAIRFFDGHQDRFEIVEGKPR